MHIPLKDDYITNISDDSWSESNRSEYTDFGDTINTDLTFEFEHASNFDYSATSGFMSYDAFDPEGATAFEVTVWLIENAERLKELAVEDFKTELSKLSGQFYRDAYERIGGDLRQMINHVRSLYPEAKLYIVPSGDAVDVYLVDETAKDYKGQLVESYVSNDIRDLGEYQEVAVRKAIRSTYKLFYPSMLKPF